MIFLILMKHDLKAAHRISLIFKFCRKERACLNPWHEDMVTFPEIELE